METYETEKTYVKCLSVVCDLFLKKFEKIGAMTKDDIRQVFGNLPQLKQLQEQFLEALKTAIGDRKSSDRDFFGLPHRRRFQSIYALFYGIVQRIPRYV